MLSPSVSLTGAVPAAMCRLTALVTALLAVLLPVLVNYRRSYHNATPCNHSHFEPTWTFREYVFWQMQVSKTAGKNSRWNNSGHGHTKSIQRPSLQPLYRDNLPCVSKLNSYGIVPSIQLPSLQNYQSHLNQLSYLLVDCEKNALARTSLHYMCI